MKRKCAKKAFEMIEDGMMVGLGGGSTVGLLIEELERGKKCITAVTPSGDTMELCIKHHIPVLPLEMADAIDLAFDGCDEVDQELNALKSCGGIHTREKIVASMAKDYVLLADEKKYEKHLAFEHPVTVEVVRSGRSYVKKCLEELGATVTERKSAQKMGLVISDDGHYLMEASFLEVKDVKALAEKLDAITGIVDHSLFYQVASKAIIAKDDEIFVIEKGI
ncbi:MAG: ribose 5-phosphate isomerase A [Lachnospiraceae bacterium]|nr:ribose 5-phosphate isomerase A [Lachnospiraceae bacterium]